MLAAPQMISSDWRIRRALSGLRKVPACTANAAAGVGLTTSNATVTTPGSVIPRRGVAASETSMIRFPLYGPRSLIRTTTLLPAPSTRRIRNVVLNGSVR
jgi:hypothetical protein